ncbi:MAG: tetratricopeptide repeat protein, partial [Ruminococcus sp.]|nr:tetratricopeptide repeat protein [Ruminococcus sp.]
KEEAKVLDKRVEEIQSKKSEFELTAWDYFSKGNRAYLENNFYKAIDYYDKTIELDPDYAEAYYNRGSAYSIKGEYGKGIEDYSKAIKLNPDLAVAYYYRALAYEALGETEKAEADRKMYEKLRAEQGDSPDSD